MCINSADGRTTSVVEVPMDPVPGRLVESGIERRGREVFPQRPTTPCCDVLAEAQDEQAQGAHYPKTGRGERFAG